MPNNFIFEIETTLTPKQVVTIAAKANNAISKSVESPFTFSAGYVFVVGVKHSDNPITKQVCLEEYGFVPTVQVTFEHGYSIDPETVNPILKNSVIAMLKEIQGNAVFRHNYENIKLLRIDDEYEVEESPHYDWLISGLKEEGFKFKRLSEQPILA